MMSPEDVLAFIIGIFEKAGIPFMVAGSFASNLYGIPRATQDADIVVEVDAHSLQAFEDLLSSDFYFPGESAREAIAHRSMFNVIHMPSGFKVDLIVRKDRAFSQEEFSRRRRGLIGETACWFVSPEDSILSKLEWSRKGESERQFHDAVGIARVQSHELDLAYMRRWAAALGVTELLERLILEMDAA